MRHPTPLSHFPGGLEVTVPGDWCKRELGQECRWVMPGPTLFLFRLVLPRGGMTAAFPVEQLLCQPNTRQNPSDEVLLREGVSFQ